MTASEQEKKRKETVYLEEARRASSLFPSGKVVPHEKPDFLLHADGRTIGIEVTELCREGPRAEGGKLAKVADAAKLRYSRSANNRPLEVSAAFAPRIEHLGFNELVDGLVNFVQVHQNEEGCFNWNDIELPHGFMPQGYCYIAIHRARGAGQWRTFKAFDVTLAGKDLLEAYIGDKNSRLPVYRAAAREVWLLIINDQFLGAGEVYARPDDLAKWKFSFDFDKVLLFSREPGGTGDLIELRREECD
jgi:hypothetical protein